ncbi:hypothetical protein [Microbispora sp. KK1-11]|uniref:hypothetical protein n=1 Tax=Microbispora sp. KK1-11 TaxID=2053005 RepID=UPI001159D0E2|nr:hypothetical protein [Microbispora sp. KK1-11]TQS22266.1 hypothetical protein FLW16_38235 [Microbispora sp. KK1-11]
MRIKTTDGQPPRSERMTGLDQGQVDWLYEQLAQMVEREASTGRPRVLPLSGERFRRLFDEVKDADE